MVRTMAATAAFGCLLLGNAIATRGASIFGRPFTGDFTVTAATRLDSTGISLLPDAVGQVNPVTITFTDNGQGGFDADFNTIPVQGSPLPGRTTNSSISGSTISWTFISTVGTTDVAQANYTGTLSLDAANDAYSIGDGTVVERLLVDMLPAGQALITVAEGTFTAEQPPGTAPPPPPTGIPLPAGVWAGLIAAAPLALLWKKRRTFV
jgi:hypothetical protein